MTVEFVTVSHPNSSITEVEVGKWNSIVTAGGRVTVDGVVCYYGNVLKTKERVDLTEINSISATFSLNSYTNRVSAKIMVTQDDLAGTGEYERVASVSTGTDVQSFPVTLTLDTSELTGFYYVGFVMNSYDTSTSKHNGYIYDISELEIPEILRTFQDGIVGRTNIIEGMIISIDNPYEQKANYLSMYEGGDSVLLASGTCWRTYSVSQTNAAFSATFSPLKISSRYASEYGYVTSQGYDLTEYVSMHLKLSDIQNTIWGSSNQTDGTSSNVGKFGWLGSVFSSGTSSSKHSFELAAGSGASCESRRDKVGDVITNFYASQLDITDVTGSKYLFLAGRSHWNANSGGGSVTFAYATLAKADDWGTLASKAGITASSIDELLLASNTLLSNKDAVWFMVAQCTGNFMMNAIANEIFLTALNNSPYKAIVQGNEHWAKFLAMVA